MSEIIKRCDCCGKITALENGASTNKIERTRFIKWKGVWIDGDGHNYHAPLHDFSGYVCHSCLFTLRIKIEELRDTFNDLKNSNKESVSIQKTYEGEKVEHAFDKRTPWERFKAFFKK